MRFLSRKRLIRFALIPLVILILLVGIAVGILVTEQQRLVKLAVTELNKQLPDGDLQVGGSEISLLQNWPYISIALTDVSFYQKTDTSLTPICSSERVYVGFSLPDILRHHYTVKALSVKNGYLHLLKDSAGNINIVDAAKFVSASPGGVSSGGSQPLDLDARKIVFKNMDVSYLDLGTKQKLSSHVERIQAALRLEDTKIIAGLTGKLQFDFTRPGDTTLFRHKHFSTDIQLSYDTKAKILSLPEGKIQLEDAVFNVTGMADLTQDDSVNLHITGDKPDFKQLFAFAPASVAAELKHFRYDGQLPFDGVIRGKLKGGKMPYINLKFACADAYLHNTIANRRLDSLSFKGYFTNGAEHSLKTSELRIMDMSARPDKGRFTGNFVMRDFTDPKVLMQVNSELELGFIGSFLGIKDLERLSGHIALKMDFRELVDIDMPQQSLTQLTQGIQSELTVTNLGFRIPDYPYTIEHLNLHAQMKNGYVTLDSLDGMVGQSDFHLKGYLDDLPALFHHRDQLVNLHCQARSNKLVLKELMNDADTTKNKWAKEEIYGFNIGLALQASVDELLHPHPLPEGHLTIDSLYAHFKRYPHAFHDFGADLTINDTALMLKNFGGSVDSSDLAFSGRVINYALWFQKVKRGNTTLAFDLKSRRLAMKDLLGKHSSLLLPPDYRQETGQNLWLRSKIYLEYDSTWKFANIKVAHVSGTLVNHAFQLDSVSGNVKFGIDNYIKIDTLKGKVGNSDFNLSMRIYNGKDTTRRKKENYLQFSSRLLDVDQLSNYRLTEADTSTAVVAAATPTASAPAADPATPTATAPAATANAATPAAADHKSGYNIFQIPFIDFNAKVSIAKLRYHKLGLKNFDAQLRMQANQQLYLDTLGLEVAGGRIAGSAHFNGTDPQKIYLQSHINLQEVNLEKLLLKLDYLGQDYVINKNIIGTVNGEVDSYVLIHPDFTPQIDQSEAQINVEIHNGALINFTPLQAMSAYFKDKNLNMVRFDTLRNHLSFKNGALIIPDMNINSSLGFLEIAGKQSMDMQMEYDMRIPLKLVTDAGFSRLFGKKKEEVDPNQVDAIEYRDKDKRIHFINLKIVGTPDNYKIHLGKAKGQTS